MNWDQLKGNWQQFKGKLRERWGELTDDELDKLQRAGASSLKVSCK